METSPGTAAVSSSSRGRNGRKTRKGRKKSSTDVQAIIYNGTNSVHIITNPTKLFSSEPAGLKEQLDLAEQIIAVNEDLIKIQKKIIKGLEEQENMGFETERASQLWSMKQLAAKTMYKSTKAEKELRSLMDSLKIEDEEEMSGDEIPKTNTEGPDIEVAAQSVKVKGVVNNPTRRYARAKRQSKGHAKNSN